jgi:hypothetical protein
MQIKTVFVEFISLAFLLLLCFTDCDTTSGSTKSPDAFLKSLSIKNSNVELIDNFDPKTTSYSVNVPYTTVSVTVYAEGAHEKASLAYQPENAGGEFLLNVGDNSITITVIAEDESIQEYIIKITRAASDEKVINAFFLGSNEGVINGETIVITVPYGTDVTKLAPTVTISGKSLNPASGVEQDFTNPITYTVTADDDSHKNYTVTVIVAASDTKEISRFAIGQNAGIISGTVITITAPYGTDVTKLAPTIIFSGKSMSPASGVEQDFTNPVIYTVTADDGSEKSYTVFIKHTASDTKEIYVFSIGNNTGIISGTNITVIVPYGTDVTGITPAIIFSGKSISPVSGVKQDFSDPVIYTGTADDGSEKEYTIIVIHAPSSGKEIQSFAIGPNVGVISGTSITVTVPYGTDITNLVPIVIFSGKSLSPASGTAQNFSDPVTYTVTADDDSEKTYTVIMIHAPSPVKEIHSFTIGSNIGVISGTNITVTIPYEPDITALTPTVIFSGKSISPASGTVQNFSDPVTYTVTADDGSEKEYTITVIRQGKPSITVEFTGITNEQIDLTADAQKDLSRKAHDELEISVNGDPLVVIWFIDGERRPNLTSTDITIAAGDYPVGVHYVTAMVYRNGIPYSNELTFRVVE